MIPNFIEDLVRAGMSEAEIGREIGRSQPSVNRMRRGKQGTDYETGRRLEALHRQRCTPAQEPGRAAA